MLSKLHTHAVDDPIVEPPPVDQVNPNCISTSGLQVELGLNHLLAFERR
jgi:hypothetical protein